MSRIGKKLVNLPAGVSISVANSSILSVKGPKGSLSRDTFGRVEFKVEGSTVTVSPTEGEAGAKYWGLYRTLLSNMVQGVSEGFTRSLELHGTGYRASVAGKDLQLVVGYSHPVSIQPPVGISFDVDKSGKINILGSDKEIVGQVAAKVRAIRPPEPYHGKGIRYLGEVIATKVGKSAGKK
jgi:large subunit ribosomal protein L6